MSILKEIFLQNKVFAHPTEGVWGLGCNPFSEEAVENLFNLKLRPRGERSNYLSWTYRTVRSFSGRSS